jgi:hypothetical protein
MPICGVTLIPPRVKHGAGLCGVSQSTPSGRLINSPACLHAVVSAFVCLQANAFGGELDAPHKLTCFGTQAWQDVAPYSSRRHSQDCLPERQAEGSRKPRKRDFEDSTCICLPARSPACGAKAGTFLINLKKFFLQNLVIAPRGNPLLITRHQL